MKIIRPELIAAVLLVSTLAAAQRSDPSMDDPGSKRSEETATERASRTGATRNEPNVDMRDDARMRDQDTFDKDRLHLRGEISDLRREVEVARDNAPERNRGKLDELVTRIDDLDTRTTAVEDPKEFRENKHKYTNELRKIRRELRGVKSRSGATQEPATPGLR